MTSDLSREGLLKVVRDAYEATDPMPADLVERMQVVVQTEAILADTDLDYELLVLVERSNELVGARGTAAYTLRFAHDDTEVLLRAADSDDGNRLDGWLAPAAVMHLRLTEVTHEGEGRVWESSSDARGRFEFRELPAGLFRLWLEPVDGKPFGTPVFEI